MSVAASTLAPVTAFAFSLPFATAPFFS